MSDETVKPVQMIEVREGKTEYGETNWRDGFKPSAPVNLIIPQPVPVPLPPQPTGTDKKE